MNPDNNPYAGPAATATTPQQKIVAGSLEAGSTLLASQNQRFLGYLLDIVVYYVLCFAAGMVLGIIVVATGQNPNTSPLLNGFFPNIVAYVVLFISYFVIEATTGGRSLGKLATGTKVVSSDGTPASIGQYLGRTACRFIPFEAFSFLFGQGRPAGWHDSISKTRVITLK